MQQRILATAIVAASTPLHAQDIAPIDPAAARREITALADSLAKRDEFSGIVAVARGDSLLFVVTRGWADRERKRPIDANTALNIGSLNKLFTATAIRQLHDAGTLHLDSTLATYWPDYPNPDVARRVTIRQIIMMQSGIGGDIFAAPPGGTRHDVRHNRDYLQLFVNRPLEFEPGTKERYSNAGYVVLGNLVERVSGEDYYTYVQRHIFAPSGMTRTGSWPVDSLPPNTALGYTRKQGDGLRPNDETLPGRGSSAGGGYSTVHDLLAYGRAVRAGKLPPGLGKNTRAAGGAPGLNAIILMTLPGDYDLVVLENLDPPSAESFAELVRARLSR